MEAIQLFFDKGTLLLANLPETLLPLLPGMEWDKRTRNHRAPAYCYRDILLVLKDHDVLFEDHARQFDSRDFPLQKTVEARPYQQAAMRAWQEQGSLGIVALPTGSGKTLLAVLLIEKTRRPTLVHVPTIDLMHQWHSVLRQHFTTEIGLLGGGYHELGNP